MREILKKDETSRNSGDAGFVSIVVCIIIMTILSLITLSFAQIMSREQRQALDRVLSTQAFYAAESGINDAIHDPAGYTDNSCTANDVDVSLGVRITCVTYDDTPPNHTVDALPVDPSSPDVFALPIGTDSIRIDFRANSPSSTAASSRSNNDLPTFANWGTNPGALKVQILPFINSDDREAIINRADSFIVIPRDPGAAGGYKSGPFGRILQADCDATGQCSITINAIPPPDVNSSVTVVMSSLYTSNSVTTTAINGAGTPIDFVGDQAVIDSTGRTTDVVRRIQVRVSLTPGYTYAGGGIVSTGSGPGSGVCKLIQAAPSPAATTNSAPCTVL